MIGRDDTRNTLEFDEHYILMPQYLFERRAGEYSEARPCADGFEYESGTNPWFMGIEELRQMVVAIGDDYTNGHAVYSNEPFLPY